MGGLITVIVREESGKIHKMARWTNTMSDLIDSVGFIEKDPAHLQSYLNSSEFSCIYLHARFSSCFCF